MSMRHLFEPADRAFIYDRIAGEDFLTFVRPVFRELNPGTEFVENWHLDAVAHAIMQVVQGPNQRLIVNLPPRSLKSLMISVALPAFILGRDPTRRIICISYSDGIADKFTADFRKVIASPWYRRLFPRLSFVKNTDREQATSEGGSRFATTVGGSLTGRGGNLFLIDDPIKPGDALSSVKRDAVNEWLGHTLASRLDDQRRDKMILTMQRLHVDDPAGVLLASGLWPHLNLPAIPDADQTVPLTYGRSHLWRAGEPLDPVRQPLEVLDALRTTMGERAFAGQYLQQPHPPDGSVFKRPWFRFIDPNEYPYDDPAAFIVQSWDVALTEGEGANWSVCTTWLIRGDCYYLIEILRKRLPLPDLVKAAHGLYRGYRPRHVLIEDNGIGKALIQLLEAQDVPVDACNSRLDKEARAMAASVAFETGLVFFSSRTNQAQDVLLEELLAFPNGRHDDQVDSMSQCINWWEEQRAYAPPRAIFGRY